MVNKCKDCKNCAMQLDKKYICVAKKHYNKAIDDDTKACVDYQASFLVAFKKPQLLSKVKGV